MKKNTMETVEKIDCKTNDFFFDFFLPTPLNKLWVSNNIFTFALTVRVKNFTNSKNKWKM